MPKLYRYPNPGYLGSSSYTTFFGQLPVDFGAGVRGDAPHGRRSLGAMSEAVVHEVNVTHGAELIQQIRRYAQVQACVRLVRGWLATGANLALAGSFTMYSVQSVETILPVAEDLSKTAAQVSKDLFVHSCRPLQVTPTTVLTEYCAQFGQENPRWEMLCLFFIAVSRATLGFRCHEPPFDSEIQRRNIRRLAMHYADRCLDILLSLDCLNDIQLILQYENFILHTLVDGDQSKLAHQPGWTLLTVPGFESWRKLGDVASSLFALGYHQNIEDGGPIPDFIRDLRHAAFACSYSADKNVSIFLGRPPRISKKYCHFRPLGLDSSQCSQWAPDATFDFAAESRWAAMCAILKEDALELYAEQTYEDRARKAR